jgi:preflagellin peptidase FlaK
MITELFSFLGLCIGSCLLVYASYSDVKTREISDLVWILMSVFGVFFILAELFIGSGSLPLFQLFISLAVGAIFALLLYFLNFGGADVKAIISLSVLFPTFPAFYFPGSLPHLSLSLPITGIPPLNIFVLSTLTNALLIALSSPISLFLYNSIKKHFSPLMFLGYKVSILELSAKKNFKLMHGSDGIEKKYVWGGVEPTEEVISCLEELEQKGKLSEVWVTPELPFILYLTAGFFTAVFYGDFISALFF